MNVIEKNTPIKIIIKRILHQARTDTWNGTDFSPYFNACRWFLEGHFVSIILTRDVYHHESGWWKNPDYERCWHLSLGFYDRNKQAKDKDIKKTELFLTYIFAKHKRKIWTEPPYSDQGKKKGIWHYRLFCDPNWIPIIPRKEVYSKDYTEPGWMSYSELQAYHK